VLSVNISASAGFGFVRPDGGDSDVFFHVRSFVNLPDDVELNERDAVSFEVGVDPSSGKSRAQNLRLI
jgi:cold shock CspA family protein